MSDALKYLMEVKPDAMRDYFSFIKQSGQHLDDKTRAIISIITKVDNQTERGLRQYVRRGLDTGLSPVEIIDALFVAFPTLGLSKIVWATDILLDMDIPGFQVEHIRDKKSWHEITPVSELDEGVNFCGPVDKRELIVLKNDETCTVYDRRCPHQSGRLPAECNAELEIRCPVHQWLFSLHDGRCIEGGERSLTSYECKVESNVLFVYW